MKLYLIRHAKSSWADAGQSDFDRGLNARGERDGPKMAQWLAEQAPAASWLWTSPAARANATATFVRNGFGLDEDAVCEAPTLYLASTHDILDVIRSTPGGIDVLAVVGHNPGMTQLVNHLAGIPATDNLPTLGIARFDVRSDENRTWADLRPERCRLEILVAPKTLP